MDKVWPDDQVDSYVVQYGTGDQIPSPPTFVNYRNSDSLPSERLTVPKTTEATRPAKFVRSWVREPPLAHGDEESQVNIEDLGGGPGGEADRHMEEGKADEEVSVGHGVESGHVTVSLVETGSGSREEVLGDGPRDPHLEANIGDPIPH